MLRNKAGHHRKVPGTGAEIQRSGNFKLSGGTDLVGSGYRRLLVVRKRRVQFFRKYCRKIVHKPFCKIFREFRNRSGGQQFAYAGRKHFAEGKHLY